MSDGNYSCVINENDFVVTKIDDITRLIQLRKGRPMFLGKRRIEIYSCVGHPFGTFFQINRDGSIVPQGPPSGNSMATKVKDCELKDNRALPNDGDSQKLTTSDIEELKATEMPGEEIVKMIVESSSSFKKKSVYSQEKYLKRKRQKYVNILQVLKPCIRLLAETYYNYSPQKICYLRIDTLGRMLEFCNVSSGNKYLVVDSVLGLLVASVLDRIGLNGSVLHVMMNPPVFNVSQDAVWALNLSKQYQREHLFRITIDAAYESLSVSGMNESFVDEKSSDPHSGHAKVGTAMKEDSLQEVQQGHLKLMEKNFDGLLIAIKHHPARVLHLLDCLAISRPFAVFSLYVEPLIDCYTQLKARGDVILLHISETWFRKYQVLSDRTHPEYAMSANSGYLMTGIKVESKT